MEKESNEKEECLRILNSCTIIHEDIRSVVIDKTNYPSANEMFDNINDQIPYNLTYFLEEVILKNKRKLDQFKLKCTSISHVVMAAARSRLFKSRLQLGLSIFFHRRFGSKRILDILSSLGVTASYNETGARAWQSR